MISYNVVKYIRQTLDSVVNQTLKDIEIIIVDKFSTDGTREIIKEYMAKDSRIKLLNDVKGSAGYSYNAGIKEACGEYIGFVETDDYVELNMFEKLYLVANENSLDYVKGDYYFFLNDTEGREINRKHNVLDTSWSSLYGKIIRNGEYPELTMFDSQMWTGIYRREFLLENKVMANESKGAAFQDHGFQWQIIANAKSCMYLEEAFYHYRKDNAAASMNNPKALLIDLEELKYIKNKISSMRDIEEDYMTLFHVKILYILHYRLHQYFAGGGKISKELTDCVYNYLEMVNNGVTVGTFNETLLDYDIYIEWRKLQKSVDAYLDYIFVITKDLINIEEKLLSFAESARKIIIFGSGDNGSDLYWFLAKHGYCDKVMAFCDNNPRAMTSYKEVKMLSVDEAVSKNPDASYIVANNKWTSAMNRQLIKMGVNNIKTYNYKWKLESVRGFV